MASPFVPVPMPLNRGLSAGSRGGNKSRKPQRASSLGCVSSSTESSAFAANSTTIRPGGERGGGGGGRQHQSRCPERGNRSRTPPLPTPTLLHSPVIRARLNGLMDTSVEYSSNPNTDPPSGPDYPLEQGLEERPITPTVLGYEVMEERAKFTVYKVLVRKCPEESWVIFRRYADFSRLNDKLKEMFPGFRLALPPKRWFKDNYETDFLEDRQLGLQAFLQNLVAHKDIAQCMAVREFLCLDDPPGPFDSLEESRAFCETLEESNYRLQKELLEKQREISSLRKRLEEKGEPHLQLERLANGECVSPESPCVLSALGSESSVEADAEAECSTAEADQDLGPQEKRERWFQSVRSSSACWCGPSLSGSPPVIQVTPLYQAPPAH
ncbi:LOW QUALITY PROTEIN: sorting nexin-16 [Aplochiton taeniatus]